MCIFFNEALSTNFSKSETRSELWLLVGSAYWHADGVVEAVFGRQLHSLLKNSGAWLTEEPTGGLSHRIHLQAVGDVQSRARSS